MTSDEIVIKKNELGATFPWAKYRSEYEDKVHAPLVSRLTDFWSFDVIETKCDVSQRNVEAILDIEVQQK